MKPRKIYRIARWEVTKNAGGVDRRTIVIGVLIVALFGVVGPIVASGGVGLEDDLYRVAVEEDSPYYEVAQDDDTFRVVPVTDSTTLGDEAELIIEGGQIRVADTRKAEAAYSEFRDSVRAYNNRQLSTEANQTAAFPVSVTVEFREQDLRSDETDTTAPNETSGSNDGGGNDGTGSGGGANDGSGADPGGGGTDPGGPAPGGVDATGPLTEDEISGSPADIDPPFPFQSLVLAFIFVIPLNFLIQLYGSTILSERLNRRGELLLVSPVSRFDIISGKTLPYFLGAMVAEGVIAGGLVWIARGEPGGILSVLAMMPLVLLFLGATFLGAMFARSFKELTFVTVTITVFLTSYAFVPAIFTDVNAIALISPLTLVVRDLQGQSVEFAEFAFSATPPLLSALVCFGLGAGLYREEDMFDQRSIGGKVLDALAGPISRPFHVGIMTMVLIPFVFVIQLLSVALLFALGATTAIVLILVIVAVVEEIAKSLHIYASYEHGRFQRTTKVALILGTASGIGFFVAENITLLAQLVGLNELDIGQGAFAGESAASGAGPAVILLLFLPLALHVSTACISAVGASRDRASYLAALVAAILVHLAYNLTVVMLVG